MAKHDWDRWRRIYVVGDDNVTLPSIALIPGAPSLPSLKRVSASELWADQRKRYRTERDTSAAVSVAQQAEKIINAAEMLTQHNQVAKLLISQGVQALRGRDPSELSDKDALAFIKAGIEIQRLTEGLATERQALTHDGGVEVKVIRRIVDANH